MVMTTQSMLTQEQVMFLKMTARSIKVGDILKTRWGLREVLDVMIGEGDVWVKFRDNKWVTGEYATVEVLVQ
jgi:hypothetical protein